MVAERSYKIAFILAITLHLVLLIFLLIKFTSSRHLAVTDQANFISATAINEKNFDNEISKMQSVAPTPAKPQQVQSQSQPVKNITQPAISSQPKIDNNSLQKSLLTERAKELAELKKQVRKKTVQKQMQESLSNELASEQQQLAKTKAQTQAESQAQTEAHGRQIQGEVDRYKALVLQAISSQWIVPDGVDKSISCQLLVSVAPGGIVMNVQLIKSSGNELLDRSAQTAVMKASPLPVPKEPELFDSFRTIKLTVRPEGIIGG